MVQPWKKLRELQRSDYQIFQAVEWEVEDPRDASTASRITIETSDWVMVVARVDTNELLLVSQFRFGTDAASLELPGGVVEAGEAPVAAAARELEEETGFRARSLTLLGALEPNPAIFANRLHVVLAEGCSRIHAGMPDPGEALVVERYPIRTVYELARSGKLTHALVLAALFIAEPKLASAPINRRTGISEGSGEDR